MHFSWLFSKDDFLKKCDGFCKALVGGGEGILVFYGHDEVVTHHFQLSGIHPHRSKSCINFPTRSRRLTFSPFQSAFIENNPERRQYAKCSGLDPVSQGEDGPGVDERAVFFHEFLYFGKEQACVLLQLERIDECIEKCDFLSGFNPNHPEVLMTLCRAYSLKGDTESASTYYYRVLDVLSGADRDYVPLIECKTEFAALSDKRSSP